ncbi:unnamed protein product [Phaeothamnion confervicola]
MAVAAVAAFVALGVFGAMRGMRPRRLLKRRADKVDAKAKAKANLQKSALASAASKPDYAARRYTLRDLLELPSSWDKRLKYSDTTVILNHFLRSSLDDQLDMILRGTVQPKEVWVCLFGSPNEKEYLQVIERYKQKNAFGGALHVIASDHNFKYYGRFQLALQATTKYVWIVDDDVIPGPAFLELLTHTINTAAGHGVLGSTGWLMPRPPGAPDKADPQRYYGRPKEAFPKYGAAYNDPSEVGGLYFPDVKYGVQSPVLLPADLLCSQWFFEQDWLRLLFREKWITYETAEVSRFNFLVTFLVSSLMYRLGLSILLAALPRLNAAAPLLPFLSSKKDYMLSYTVRRYAGVESFVLPEDPEIPEYSGDMAPGSTVGTTGAGALEEATPLAAQHRTTVGSIVPARQLLWQQLVARGGRYFWTSDQAPPELVLLVVRGAAQAAALGSLYRALASQHSRCHVFLLIVREDPSPVPLGWEAGFGAANAADVAAVPSVAAPSDCAAVAVALGLSKSHDSGGGPGPGPVGELARWEASLQAQGRERSSRWFLRLGGGTKFRNKRNRFYVPESDICHARRYGVFFARVGLDFTRAPNRGVDAASEVVRALSEVISAHGPVAVVYIGRENVGGGGAIADPIAEAVVDAVELVMARNGGTARSGSSVGGPGLIVLPPSLSREGATAAAAAMAFLPRGGVGAWARPQVTVLLLCPVGATAADLTRTLEAVSALELLGDEVNLQLVLPTAAGFAAAAAGSGSAWAAAGGGGAGGASGGGDGGSGGAASATAAAIEALAAAPRRWWPAWRGRVVVTRVPSPDALSALEAAWLRTGDDFVVPLVAGQEPPPPAYLWLKAALIAERYATPSASAGAPSGRSAKAGGKAGAGGAAAAKPEAAALSLPPASDLGCKGMAAAAAAAGLGGGCPRLWLYSKEAWRHLQAACAWDSTCTLDADHVLRGVGVAPGAASIGRSGGGDGGGSGSGWVGSGGSAGGGGGGGGGGGLSSAAARGGVVLSHTSAVTPPPLYGQLARLPWVQPAVWTIMGNTAAGAAAARGVG